MPPDKSELKPLPSYIYIAVAIASFDNFSGFYSLSLLTAALLYIPYSFELSWISTAVIVTGTLVGGMIGSLAAGPVADKIGRRPCQLSGSSVLLFGSLLVTFAPNLWTVAVGRFISGIGIGIVTTLSNLIIVELAPCQKRGSLSTIPYVFQFLGTMCPFLVGYLIVLALPGDLIYLTWRLIAASGVLVALVDLVAAVAFLPESPRWLIFHDRTLEGLALMERIYGRDNHEALIEDYRSIISCPQDGEHATWVEIAQNPKFRKPVLVGMSLQVIRKLSGNAAITFYLTLILVEAAGVKKSTALLISLLIYIPDFLTVFAVFKLLDRLGRKALLFMSCVGLALTILPMALVLNLMGTATGALSLQEHRELILNYLKGFPVSLDIESTDPHAMTIRVVVIASLFLQRCFYSFGLGPVPSIHTAETLPQPVRAKGLGLALFVSWTVAAITTLLFPWALIHLQAGAPYWCFFAVAILGIPFVFFAVRETAHLPIDNRHHHHPSTSINANTIHQPTPVMAKSSIPDANDVMVEIQL